MFIHFLCGVVCLFTSLYGVCLADLCVCVCAWLLLLVCLCVAFYFFRWSVCARWLFIHVFVSFLHVYCILFTIFAYLTYLFIFVFMFLLLVKRISDYHDSFLFCWTIWYASLFIAFLVASRWFDFRSGMGGFSRYQEIKGHVICTV